MPQIKTKKELEILLENTLLVLMVGNIGTGKTTISNFLRKFNTFNYLSGDELGKKMHITKLFGFIYTETYDTLKKGISVLIDGRNLVEAERRLTISPALKMKMPVLIVDCGKGILQDLQRRLEENNGISADLWKKDFEENQLAYEEPQKTNDNLFIIKKEIIQSFDDFKDFLEKKA